jgi:GNAT superfamily N-acetyltransferase
MQRPVTAALRALQPADLPAVASLSEAVGWPHRAPDWALFLSLGEGLAACASDGAIVGTALRWRWSAACASVGMVLVAPAQQGRGVGRQLMQALLAEAAVPAVMLNATEAGVALYERLGFRPVGTVVQHQGIFAANPSQGSSRPAAAEWPDIIALDYAAFGVARPALLERLLADGETRVITRDGRLQGFAVRRTFGRGDAIGPLVAANQHDAMALVASLLRPGFLRIDIPAEATALAAWLTQAGLVAVDKVTAMVRGAWPPSGAAARRFALASQAFG